MTDRIGFTAGGVEMLDPIQGMWSKLTLDASKRSAHFSGYFAGKTWEERRAELLAKASKGPLRVDVARLGDKDMGYCISSVVDGSGEVDSLFVEEGCRGRKVGEALVQRSVAWMKENGAATMVVLTVYGNDGVLPFYARQGFRPISVVLKYDERGT